MSTEGGDAPKKAAMPQKEKDIINSRRKLEQIERLLARQAKGVGPKLSEAETEKVGKKDGILKSLKSLLGTQKKAKAAHTEILKKINGEVESLAEKNEKRKEQKKLKIEKNKRKREEAGDEKKERESKHQKRNRLAKEKKARESQNDGPPAKIYVRGMPFDVTEKRLRNVFGRFGVILSLDMPCFEDSGRSKGVAYIEFQTTKAATKALKLHESRMGARYIEVFESDFTPNTREIADQPPGCKTLFVGNLSHQIEEPALKDFFQTVGVEFESVHWGTDKETGEKKGFAFVDFKDEASAGKAVQAAGKQLLGRTVRLDFHVSNSAWDDDAGAATTPVSGDQDMAAAGSEEAPKKKKKSAANLARDAKRRAAKESAAGASS